MRATEIRDSCQLIPPSDLSPAAAAFRPPRGVGGANQIGKKQKNPSILNEPINEWDASWVCFPHELFFKKSCRCCPGDTGSLEQPGAGVRNEKQPAFFFFPTSCVRALRCLIKNLLSQALGKCGDALPLLSSAVRPRRHDKTSVIWRGNRSGDQYSGALGENYYINPPNRGVRSSFSRYRRYWMLHLV